MFRKRLGLANTSTPIFQRAFTKLCVFVLGSILYLFITIFSYTPDAWACDPNAIEWVAVSPTKVEVPVGGQATVSAIVRCRTNGRDFINATRAEYEIRLMSENASTGEVTELEGYQEAFNISLGQGFRIGHTTQINFNVTCAAASGARAARIRPQSHLPLDGAANLMIQIDNGVNTETQLHQPHNAPQGVSAMCVQGLVNQSVGGETNELTRTLLQKSGNAFTTLGDALQINPVIPSDILTGAYIAETFVVSDDANQEAEITIPDKFTMTMAVDEITLRGTGDWVTVKGLLSPDGRLIAQGVGIVAGTPGVSAVFRGVLAHGELMGEYTLGVDGNLPGGKPVVYHTEARSTRWVDFWEHLTGAFVAAAEEAGTLNFTTSALGIDLREPMATLTSSLLNAAAEARYGPSVELSNTMRDVGDSIKNVADLMFISKLEGDADIGREIDQASELLEDAAEFYGDVLGASILIEGLSTVSVESAVDTDNNGRINDGEIMDAIRLWVRRDVIPGSGQIIFDHDILVIVELWILGQQIEESTSIEQNTRLTTAISGMLDKLAQAGNRLKNAGKLLLDLAQ